MTDAVLSGTRAIATGASQGLGREIARHFLAAGADVAICARSKAEIEEAAARLQAEHPGRRVLARVCDIARTAEIDRFYDAVLAEFGGLDAVVNNAGVLGPAGALDEVDWPAWEEAIAVNLTGTAYSCRRAVAAFKQRGASGRRGKIINLSGGGATAPQPGLTAYGAAKAGLVRFTETLAQEVKDFADVNAVAPGALATRMMAELVAAGPKRIGAAYHARIKELEVEGGMPIARAAELCVYLASPASDGITGKLLSAAWDAWPFDAAAAKALSAGDIYTLRRITPEDRGKRWDKKK